jgi:hypothetical protein
MINKTLKTTSNTTLAAGTLVPVTVVVVAVVVRTLTPP